MNIAIGIGLGILALLALAVMLGKVFRHASNTEPTCFGKMPIHPQDRAERSCDDCPWWFYCHAKTVRDENA